MSRGRIVALVAGCLLVVPSLAILISGAALSGAYAFALDDDGYFTVTLDDVESPTAAVTTEDTEFTTDPGTPSWVIDRLDLDLRLRITPREPDADVFIGIATEGDLDAYLSGVAHDEITGIDDGRAEFRRSEGTARVAPPTEQDIWVESASGPAMAEVTWEAVEGRWAAVAMNADGSPGVAVDVEVGAKAGFVLPLALTLIGSGLALTAVAVVLIVFGARGRRSGPPTRPGATAVPGPAGRAIDDQLARVHPVSLTAELDSDLSRWMWLVKWLLAIPHFVVLFFLWVAFAVTTFVAGVAIVFTGRYPHSLFDFNVGVLCWSWRVSHYATTGGLGTDRYPRFGLDSHPDDAATLDVAYPDQLSRWLVLVKWWLLAIPHYLVLALLFGSFGWDGDTGFESGGGLAALLSIIAGVALAVTGAIPRPLFDLLVGLSRWLYRVIAYAALMTDDYPPFRLDQGGHEPDRSLPPPRSQPSG